MTAMDGDELQRLWSLIEDLTHQLQANRQLCESLQAQADQLKGQAIHSGTGYALRRFNTDISKEKFESELEQLNAHLVKENQALAHENKQQSLLLREYENTLETVMGKFRSHSHSTQQHTLQLTQHYENLLANTTHNAAQTTLAAETAFSGTLQHLGALVRSAFRTMDGDAAEAGGGDDDDDDDQEQEHEDDSQHYDHQTSGQSTSSPARRQRQPKQSRARQDGWPADPRWYGSGGYTGRDLDPEVARSERALAMLTEEERLRIENEMLRELLELKERSDAMANNIADGSDHAIAADAAAGATSPVTPVKPTLASSHSLSASYQLQRSPSSPTASRNPLAMDQATIEAEGSGHPPLKALEISETLRPGDRSPMRSPIRRQDQILEEAIQEEEVGGGSSGDADGEASASAMLVHAEAIDAEGEQQQGLQGHDVGQLSEADAGLAPNVVAEAVPSALVSTGVEKGQGDGLTIVSSASGDDVLAEDASKAAVAAEAGPEGEAAGTVRGESGETEQALATAIEAEPTGADGAAAIAEATKDTAPSVEAGGKPTGDLPVISAGAGGEAKGVATRTSTIPAEPTSTEQATLLSEGAVPEEEEAGEALTSVVRTEDDATTREGGATSEVVEQKKGEATRPDENEGGEPPDEESEAKQ